MKSLPSSYAVYFNRLFKGHGDLRLMAQLPLPINNSYYYTMSPKNLQHVRILALRHFKAGFTGLRLLGAVRNDISQRLPGLNIPPFVSARIVHEVEKQFGLTL